MVMRPAGLIKQRDMLQEYADYLVSLFPEKTFEKRKLKVVVDAGNGMAGFTAGAVMEKLSVELIPMYFELDGTFPNHEANPIDPKNLKDLQKRVKKEKADLGLAFDGDADRCFLIDENGDLVNPSALTALIAVAELNRVPKAKIIYNLISSKAVPEVIAENGGSAIRSRVGHSYIKQVMAQTGAVFGGEHSGHFYFERFWRADSGMLAALFAIAQLMQSKSSISKLLQPYNRYFSSGEINSKMKNADAAKVAIDKVKAEYGSGNEIDDLDGLTITSEKWWLNLRPSNTEPLLRLNVEADSAAKMAKIRDEVLELIASIR
jgi:phosphomannomutase